MELWFWCNYIGRSVENIAGIQLWNVCAKTVIFDDLDGKARLLCFFGKAEEI